MAFYPASRSFEYTVVSLSFLSLSLSYIHTRTHAIGVMCHPFCHTVPQQCLYAAVIHVSLNSNSLVNQTAGTEKWQAPPASPPSSFLCSLFLASSPIHLPTRLSTLLTHHVMLLQWTQCSIVVIYWCLTFWPAVKWQCFLTSMHYIHIQAVRWASISQDGEWGGNSGGE